MQPLAFFYPTQKSTDLRPARQISASVLAATLSLLACAESHAQASLYLAGIQTSSTTTYTYVEQVKPLAGATLGQGWYSKARLSWLDYNYAVTQNNADVKVSANAPGLEAGMGYAWQSKDFRVDLSASAGYRYLSLKPALPADEKTGGIFTLKPQVQARWQMHPLLDADLIADTTIGMHSAFVRSRLGWRAHPDWRIGVESMQQNGSNYRIRQTGLFAATPLSNGVGLEFNTGRTEPRDGQAGNYLGVGLSRVY